MAKPNRNKSRSKATLPKSTMPRPTTSVDPASQPAAGAPQPVVRTAGVTPKAAPGPKPGVAAKPGVMRKPASTITGRAARARRRTQRVWLVTGVVVVVLVAAAIIITQINNNRGPSLASMSTPAAAGPLDKCGAPTCGDANAPATLDIYADFQCPFCARVEPVVQELGPNYVDTGKLKLVYHNMAFIGQESTNASEAALCAADQQKFWLLAKNIFSHQGAENVGTFTIPNLKALAVAVGLDAAAFNSCLDSGKYASQVQTETTQANARGVSSTPTFFLNDQKLEGAQTLEQFTTAIDAALAKK